MKKILGFEVTDKAIKIIKQIKGKEIDLMTEVEIENILQEENDLVRAENWIFLEEEQECICTYYSDYENSDLFFIKELDIYINKDCNGDYYGYYISDLGDFADYFLNYLNIEDEYDREEFYANELDNIPWWDEENELYKKIKDELSKIENENGELITIYGYGFNAQLEESLREYEEYKDCIFKELGYFKTKRIYEIGGKLYHEDDDSYVDNSTKCWYLIESSEIVYKEFGYDFNKY